MNRLIAVSPDGTPVAYEQFGTGPAVVLLHGGGGSRRDWVEAGYVERLRDRFTVIAIDLRGHGESGLPTDPAAYAIEKLKQDILAVAEACGVERFALWGMSYGGKVGRYLAVESDRVSRLIMMGTPLGPGVSGERRQQALDYVAHWPPIVQAQREGTLDLTSLSPEDREHLRQLNVPVVLGWATAMLDWPTVEPADFRCPTLWLVGTEDPHAMASLHEYKDALPDSRVRVHVLKGFGHEQLFDEVDTVFPILLAFTTGEED